MDGSCDVYQRGTSLSLPTKAVYVSRTDICLICLRMDTNHVKAHYLAFLIDLFIVRLYLPTFCLSLASGMVLDLMFL